ncbi:YqaE/Pmp3 family membrane protein [Pontibacter silvestris]|uniref:YqaE/Pmp3 family membrane protein n=1 Tax=Pontibacter silvestris TaxID=2305183 RepID=A0ABW4WZ69_9BACT|nr:YqaE/Pmp3 family membrane protein [Pontibacter silvestris]
MGIKSLLKLVVALVVGQLMFACNSAKYYEFTPNKAGAYNTIKQKPAPEQEERVAPEIAVAVEKDVLVADVEPVLEASVASTPAYSNESTASVTAPEVITKEEANITEAKAIAMAKERLSNMTRAEKKAMKKEIKDVIKYQSGSSRTSVVEIILAIILPPLAVFLHDGIGTSFWINIILTLLFFLPGIIHALLVVTDTI